MACSIIKQFDLKFRSIVWVCTAFDVNPDAYSGSEIGGREREPFPRNREIGSFRSCVRARGVLLSVREEKVRHGLVSFSSGRGTSYLLTLGNIKSLGFL